jgi:DNA-binding IclR family transcriptional regulator
MMATTLDRRGMIQADRGAEVPLPSGPTRPMVAPFARALAVLGTFTPQDRWLANGEIALRTGLPASTVTRLARSLVSLGYLVHDPTARKYRLSAAVLALGYAALANSDVQRLARSQMQAFADQHRVHVSLSSRDRLDLIVLESCNSLQSTVSLKLHVGTRVGLASSPIGWALLAALPEPERNYLLNSVERRMPREWPLVRRRANTAIAQVNERGYCSLLSEWDSELAIVAAPVHIEGHDPRVLACVGAGSQLSRARVERDLGPRLLTMARLLQQAGGAE